MSRARSKTVDTVEVKKNGIPRRLNEKIALMKKKEQAQSQAFEQAMQSIFEVMCACDCNIVMYCMQDYYIIIHVPLHVQEFDSEFKYIHEI